jgi:hypothetical protein
MSIVFISHSTSNSDVASDLKRRLEQNSIQCWKAPESILPGQTWEEAIVDAIASAQVMALVWSSASQNSDQVKRELTLACSQGKLIVPIRIEDITPTGPFAYYLSNTHWLDATETDSIGTAVSRVLEAIGKGKTPEQSSSALTAETGDSIDKHIEKIQNLLGGLSAYVDFSQLPTALRPMEIEKEILELLRQINPNHVRLLHNERILFAISLLSADSEDKLQALLFSKNQLILVRELSFTRIDLSIEKVFTHGTTRMALIRAGMSDIVVDHKAMGCNPSDIDSINDMISYSVSAASLARFGSLYGAGLYDLAMKENEEEKFLIVDPVNNATVDAYAILESACLIKTGRPSDAISLLESFHAYLSDSCSQCSLVNTVDDLVSIAQMELAR